MSNLDDRDKFDEICKYSTGLTMSKIVPLPQKLLRKKVQEVFSMDQLLRVVVYFLSLLDLYVLHVNMYILITSNVVNLDG